MNKELLLNVFLRNDSLNLLVEAVSASFGCPVIVTDSAFHIVSAFAATGFSDEEYRRAVAHSELPLTVCEAISAHRGERLLGESDTHRYCVGELKCGEVRLGYMLYVLDSGKIPNENDCLFAERLVAKQFNAERRSGGIVTDTAEEILTELLDGKFSDEEVFRLQAAGTFLASFRPSRFVLIGLSPAEARHTDEAGLSHELACSFRASHPFLYDGNMIVFLHEDHDTSLLSQFLCEQRLCAVISERLERLYDLRDAYRTAWEVLHYLQGKHCAPAVYESRDYALLMHLVNMEKRSDSLGEPIGALYRYDTENGSELCLTLYTYLCCRHSLQETCERLFTHRNTVQYRIRKIREDFGVDTDSPDACLPLLLTLALALIRLGHEELFIRKQSSF